MKQSSIASATTQLRDNVTEQLPDNQEFEELTRTQILVAMGVTAIVLTIISKAWQYFGNIALLSFNFTSTAWILGIAIGLGITVASSIVYRIWPAYRLSADAYLQLVLKPLIWPDLIWLGLLPGLSEELLFRGVMLPALGLDWLALSASSLCFGVLHLSGRNQWPYVIWASLVGLVLGYSALLTNNLLVPVIAHTITNFLSSCIWKWEN